MQLRHRQLFTTIRTEGSILPADLLQRINDRAAGLAGLSPDDYHLAGGLKLNEAINQSWNRLRGAWAVFQNALAKLPAHDPGTTVTREKWLLPLFQELGYGRLPTTRAIELESKSYPISHLWQQTPIHLVGAHVKLDERTAGVTGAARVSPHGLVQELLNRSEAHMWGFVSNGLRLRILRDNVSLTRQAFVEFDLEAMLKGELYPDFALLWLLCHESRVNAEKPQDCWLEKWSKAAHEQGTRALEQLRIGVEEAIKALGRGFLAHPANQTLLDKLRKGELDKQDYYRQLLRLVYRLLFLFVAEDRELLFAPAADEKTRERYTRFYSVARLRRLAERRLGTRHSDLYHGLRLVMQKLGDANGSGCPELGLPALGSFLFSNEAIADLDGCDLANHDLLEAVRALVFITDRHGRRTVDYKNLRSEELGSVYEALLELHPEINAEARQFNLQTASGNERKTTGSYYTPDSLVQCLLDSALDPVVEEARKQPDPEQALLRLKVVDPACGSGHFLIAAAHRLSKHLAAVRTGDDEPAPAAVRRALRDVIGHCIYGVDANPMAVELCKVSLWMEALEPGRPLSFLEHRIQCGNSLIGTTPALLKRGIPDEAFKPIEGDDKEVCAEYKRLNKNERLRFQDLFVSPREPWEMLGNLAVGLMGLEEIGDDDIADIRRKQERWEQLVRSSDYRNSQLLADSWCAAFVWRKTRDRNHPYPITEELFRRIEENPWHVARGPHEAEIRRLAEQYRFFHWHLAFPDVFRVPVNEEKPENVQAGWRGGFDVVLGNPPWEKLQTEELQFFASRNPEIAALKGAKRKAAIKALKETNPSLATEWQEQRRIDAATIAFIRNSSTYPLTGVGKFNTFALFAELNSRLMSVVGRVGCIVPSGIATDDTTKLFFQHITTSTSLVSLFDFENREGLFPAVDSRMKFCLLTLSGSARPIKQGAEFVFFAHTVEALRDEQKRFTLSAADIALLNPNTLTCATFRSQRDAVITKAIYQRVPIFLNEKKPQQSAYQPQVWRLLNTTDDSDDFVSFSWEQKDELIPVIEAKTIHQFDHRFATFPEAGGDDADAYEIPAEAKASPTLESFARYYIPDELFCERMPEHLRDKRWFLTARNITNATNERTTIAAIIPRAASCEVTPYIETVGSAQMSAFLVGLLNSFALDYVARQKVGGTHLSYFILYQFPILFPQGDLKIPLEFFVSRVLELTYTAHDLQGFAADCGYTGEPFCWDEARRFLLRCELDAAYFHLYGIRREDVAYILDTFPIVRRKDEAQHGEYHTQRVILEIYDAMQQAITTGQPYQTRLDPPPALGWTPPPVKDEGGRMKDEVPLTALVPGDEPFPLQMQDARPQPTLFDDVE
jgi:hypothetical protein